MTIAPPPPYAEEPETSYADSLARATGGDWRLCPSTHCERRQECSSPHECSGTGKRRASPDHLRDRIETLEAVLRSIANRESGTAYCKQFPIESRCTVAIAYEDRARAALKG